MTEPIVDFGGSIDSLPAVCAWSKGRTDVYATGGDNSLYAKWRSSDNGKWSAYSNFDKHRWYSNITPVCWGPGRIDIFGRGTVNDCTQVTWANNRWTHRGLGGQFLGDIAAVSRGEGKLDLFGRGVDNAIWWLSYGYSPKGWSEWISLGGTLVSDPVAVSWGPDRIDVFAIGGDGAVHQNWDSGKGFQPKWYNKGGSGTIEQISAVSNGEGNITLFVRTWDNKIMSRAWRAPGVWNEWNEVGDKAASRPTAVAWGGDKVTLAYVRQDDNTVWSKRLTGDSWSEWKKVGGRTTGAVALHPRGGERLEAFSRDIDASLQEFYITV